jgi:hypothetical protein
MLAIAIGLNPRAAAAIPVCLIKDLLSIGSDYEETKKFTW